MTEQLIKDLDERGLIYQSNERKELCQFLENPTQLYCGFDPTADSLHIGSLVPMLALRRFQLAGHTPIILVGGATGLIGDPSFKASERKLNEDDIVNQWAEKIKKQLETYIDFTGKNKAIVVNNYDWISKINSLELFRDFGKYFSINTMIAKESIKQRIDREEQGISYTEFSYMIMQAIDFYFLAKEYDCMMQIGGSDQWGNITAGIDLIHKKLNKKSYVLTLPLVTKSDGTKFGKTESGTIWLDKNKTSSYHFYQFWLNTADADVYRFLKLFTFLSVEQINKIEQEDNQLDSKRQAQLILADEMTRFIRGEQELKHAQKITRIFFEEKFKELSFEELNTILNGMPHYYLKQNEPFIDIVIHSNLASSKRQAREFIQNKAVSVNGVKVDAKFELNKDTLIAGKFWIIKRGKKNLSIIINYE